MSVKDDVYYNELFSEYSALLTENQRDVFDMYYRLDLSLGEIAEIKGVSRGSVADSVSGVKKSLVSFESKLHLREKKIAVYRLIDRLSTQDKAVGEEIRTVLGED